MRFSTLFAGMALLGTAMTAQAHDLLLSPNPDEVQTVDRIDTVHTKWNVADVGYNYGTAYFLDPNWNQIDLWVTWDPSDLTALDFYLDAPITEPGEYTLVIMPNISETINNQQPIDIQYVVTGEGGSSTSSNWLLSPNPNEVQTVESIEMISTKWNIADVGLTFGTAYLLDPNWNQIDLKLDWDLVTWDFSFITMTPATPVTEPGEYTLVILPNITEKIPNETIEVKYVVTGPEDFDVVPSKITPEAGSTVTLGDGVEFNTIRLEFAKQVWLDQSGFKLTGPNGAVDFSIGGWYNNENPMFQYNTGDPFVNVDFNVDGSLPSGTYTLEIAAGAIGTKSGPAGSLNEPLSYTWEYVNTKGDADDAPLVFNSILIGKNKVVGRDANYNNVYAIDDTYPQDILTDGCEMRDWEAYNDAKDIPGDVLIFDLNHGAKAGYAYYTVYNANTQEIIRQGGLTKTDDNLWTFHVPMAQKFFKGIDYEFTIRTYSEYGANQVEYGDGATFTFTGTNEAYQFSPVELVAYSPDPDTYTFTKYEDDTFAVIFNGNVNVDDRTKINTGMGTSMSPQKIESRTGKEYDAVWYITVQKSLMDDPQINFAIYAKDEQGREVYGESGTDETAYNQVTYKYAIGQPRIRISDGNTHKASLKTFRITAITKDGAEKGLNDAYVYPELRNKQGEKICGILKEYGEMESFGTILKQPYKIIRESGGSESNPMELEFCLEKEITEPGEYILYFPEAAYSYGTQYEGETSIEQSFTYWVVPHYDLTYVHDNHSLLLAQVEEGNVKEINVTPAEGWKLNKLTLNGKDVTNEVSNGVYTTAAINDHSTLAAEYAYDGEVIEPTGMNDVVTDLNLRAWSENSAIYVAGLKAGQFVECFTTGGALMESHTLVNDDMLRFNVPAGVYIITVTEGSNRVALKVINK